ncbi:serine hydrolase family protein [Candidatus Nomurabacteria bacterium]|nr:serine hydrolase family protein [Candidatus Nomurabacteria bacterium]
MKKVYIVHGFGGIPNGGWFPWLMKELALLGIPATSILLPDTNNPDVNKWSETINKYVGEDTENVILVGHSLGVPALLRYLERCLNDKTLGGLVLVSGVLEPLEVDNPISDFRKIDQFLIPEINFENIKNIPNQSIVIHGSKDPIVPITHAEKISKAMNCELITIPEGDHFSQKMEPICYELPEVLSAIKKIITN